MFNAYSVFNEPFNVIQGYEASTPGNDGTFSLIF